MPSSSITSRAVHAGHSPDPAGAYVYVIDGSTIFGLDDREPVVLKAGESFYEQPGALHSVSRDHKRTGVTAGALSGQLAGS